MDYIKKEDLGKVFRGEIKPSFPDVIDNTTRCAYVGCSRKWFMEHLLHRVAGQSSIHLVAGAAFAEGIDRFYKAYYTEGGEYYGNYDESLIEAFLGLTEEYGINEELESSEAWRASAKSWQRMIQALLSYWNEYHPKHAQSKILCMDGVPMAEQSFSIPLPINHPVTGEPLLYHGRFDAIVERSGGLWGQDDKTTKSMGASWANSWDARSQFMGYVWGAQQYGIDLKGVIVRGTCILKNSFKHMEVPVSFPPYLVRRWYDQLLKDVEGMIHTWENNSYDYTFSDSCNSYGGCEFRDACLAKFPAKVVKTMNVRVWDPRNPAESRTFKEE